MELSFHLKGLDCPNCAAKIEHGVQNLEFVESAQVNLVNQSLSLKLQESTESKRAMTEVERIVHLYEPDVVVTSMNESVHADHDDEGENKFRVPKLILGGIIGIAAGIAAHVMPEWNLMLLPVFIIAYLILGYDVLIRAFKNISKGQVFDENLLMIVATAGAFGIQEFPEAVAVMLLYQIGEYFQDRAVGKSRKSIQSLLDIRPDKALKLVDGEQVEVMAESVVPGDIILVKPGEKIPLDGEIIEGSSMLDTRALTGESVPRSIHIGETALSGCINLNSALTIKVTKSSTESTASKIIELVQNASSLKAPAENFITKFARYYTPIVVSLAVVLALVPLAISGALWSDWLRRAFIFLVISCPCALVISVPLTYFSGLGAASRRGILVKGSNWLEALHHVDSFVFDKTGTLTKGSFEVTHVAPAEGISEDELLSSAAHAEKLSNHPIARSILQKAGVVDATPDEYTEVPGHGTSARYGENRHEAGNHKLMASKNIEFVPSNHVGTIVYVAKNGEFMGSLTIADEIKRDASESLQRLRKLGIRTIAMLTGDAQTVANDIAQKLNLDHVEANLLPSNKLESLETMMKKAPESQVAYVGDGINDAPSLARANVGIAMGALGSDAAVEAADIVLMSDNLSLLPEAVEIAHHTRRIVIQNIVFALAIKCLFLLLGALGLIGLWFAIFADVGVMLLCVANAMRMSRRK